MDELVDDLRDEVEALDSVVADREAWNDTTPDGVWTVAHQIAHLTFFDVLASTAIRNPSEYETEHRRVMKVAADDEALEELTLGPYLRMTTPELLAAWRSARSQLLDAARTLDSKTRISWFGASMGGRSFVSARLMEAWVHGQDIRDAYGLGPEVSPRLRHIAQMGVATRGWSYTLRGREPRDEQIEVSLEAPDGSTWEWTSPGEESAEGARVTGPAEDFCLVVAQRRHHRDTRLTVQGEAAVEWMELAQVFAGAPTFGPAAGERPGSTAPG